MVTTRSQDRATEESELPVRSRASDSTPASVLKRPSHTVESHRANKRARIVNDIGPEIEGPLRDEDSSETVQPKSAEVASAPDQPTMLRQTDDQSGMLASVSGYAPDSTVLQDSIPPEAARESDITTDKSRTRPRPSPQAQPLGEYVAEHSAPTFESGSDHKRFPSQDLESETFLTAETSLAHEQTMDLSPDAAEGLNSVTQGGLLMRPLPESRQESAAQSLDTQKLPQSITSNAHSSPPFSTPANPTSPPDVVPPRLTHTSPAITPVKATSASQFQTTRRHGINSHHLNRLRTHYAEPVPQSSSSLSRYRNTVFERHKRTPHWAGKKARFVDVGVR